jgi:hypothetical protein
MTLKGNFAGRTELDKELLKAKALIKESEQLHQLVNVILSNGAYSIKEEIEQIKRIDQAASMTIANNNTDALELLKYEKSLVSRTWELRRKIAKRAMLALENILLSEGLGDKGHDNIEEDKDTST